MEVDAITSCVEPEECDLKELMRTMTRDAKSEMSKINGEILSVVRALGGDQQRYKRERSRAARAIVSEIYSPPRDCSDEDVTRTQTHPGLCPRLDHG